MAKAKPKGNKVEDFNKLRKRRQRVQTIRRLLILVALTAAVAGAVFLNNVLVEQSVTTRISDFLGSFGGSGYPVPVPGGIIRDVGGVGDHLTVLNDTNLYIYSPKGRNVFNIQAMSDNTVMLTGDDRLLTYDVGAKKFAVHSRTKTLMEKELEFGIIAAGMNRRGDFALVTSSKQAICEIVAYNRKQAAIYHCSLAENLVSSVSISPKGTMMAAGWLNGSPEGVLQAGLNIYQFSNDEGPVATLTLADQLILDVRFYEEDRIGILTDREYLIAGADGSILSRYDLAGRQVAGIEVEGRLTLLLCENKDTRERELILLDGDNEEKATFSTDEKILDIALNSRRVYVLTEDNIRVFSHLMELQEVEPVQFVSRIQLVGGRLYYLDREEIWVLGMNREEESSDDEDSAAEEEEASGSEISRRESSADSEEESEPESESESAPEDESEGEELPESGAALEAESPPESEADSEGGEQSGREPSESQLDEAGGEEVEP